MPVRTAYAGAAVSGEVLTAANVNKLPGGWIGYAEVTADQATITAAVDLTGLTVSVTVNTTRRISITAYATFFSTVADDYASLTILEGGTTLQTSSTVLRASGAGQTIVSHVVLTPSSGAHTYKLQGARATGTGSLTMQASATKPAFILVQDMGPAT